MIYERPFRNDTAPDRLTLHEEEIEISVTRSVNAMRGAVCLIVFVFCLSVWALFAIWR